MGCNGSKTAGAAAAQKPQEPQLIEGDFKITLERTADGQTLGLKVAKQEGVIAIEKVNEEGLVPDFIKANANSTEQKFPEQGDRIVAVNGLFGDAEKMMAALSEKAIVLTIKKPQPAAAEAEQPVAAPAQGEPAVTEEKAAEAPAAAEATPAAGEAAPAEQAEAKTEAATEAPVAAAAEEATPAAEATVAEVLARAEEVLAAEAPAAEAPADATLAENEENVAATPLPEEPATTDVQPAVPKDADLEAGVEVAELGEVAAAEEAKEARLCRMSIC